MMRYLFVLFTSLSLLSGCSSSSFNSSAPQPPVVDSGNRLRSFPDAASGEKRDMIARRAPWESWGLYRDLDGAPLRNGLILEGDGLVQAERVQEGLERYLAARADRMPGIVRDSLMIRIASVYLHLDEPRKALDVLSDYFRATERSEESVDSRFSLIFAYAYGRQGEIDQSLAWFSRANRLSAGRGEVSAVAEQGVRLFLRVLPDDKFYPLSRSWGSDSFISEVHGNEARRRALPDYREPSHEYAVRFWELAPGDLRQWQVASGNASGTPIGVLLPLTGKFAKLGASANRGIELALLGQQVEGEYAPEIRDTAGDEVIAEAGFRELLGAGELPVVIGPLLSDVAQSLGRLAKKERVPLLSFSKRSYFETGDGVYRLGPTVETQIDSLFDAVYQKKNILRYGIVAPQNEAGEHYAEVFRNKLIELNLDLVYDTRYEPGDDTALAAIAAELEDSPVEAIFFPDTLTQASRFFGNFPRWKRQQMPLLGLAMWDNEQEIAQSRTVMEGCIFVSPFFAESQREIVQKFMTSYKNKYGHRPDFLAAQSFDAVTMVVAALRRHQSEGISFSQAMNEIDLYEGLTGSITVRPDGELSRRFAIVELFQGRLREVLPKDTLGSDMLRQ
ncbi:MAG: penicillin-binding protein activator [Bdellovibrionales bacterium]|nr:penicillin-binding protein activator [Bdellovibrionales bacterium]